MNEIRIILTETLREDYRQLPGHIQKKFDKQLRFLAQDPKHPSLRIHRLGDHWEFYIDIYYRCIFQQDGNTYILKHVGGHKIVNQFGLR
jgi:mRNA-degrading endonuclease RelE of RelBE toxin-antitoxin system